MAADPVLHITDLCKSYGTVPVLQGLCLSIPNSAGIFGIVGPNGAGKTTLFNIICGFLRFQRGAITLDGRVLDGNQRRPGEIAILAQDARFPSGVKLHALLGYYARLQGFTGDDAQKEADRVLALVGLETARRSSIEQLSHGMRKRLGIAQAFIGTPRLVILDEPTEGLDPQAARDVRRVLRDIAGQRAVLVSSHNLGEVEDLCHEVAILDRGRIVRQDRVSELLGEADEIAFHMPEAPGGRVLAAVAALAFVKRSFWDAATSRLVVMVNRSQSSLEDAAQQLLAQLMEHKARFSQMQVGKRLEDRFLEETSRK